MVDSALQALVWGLSGSDRAVLEASGTSQYKIELSIARRLGMDDPWRVTDVTLQSDEENAVVVFRRRWPASAQEIRSRTLGERVRPLRNVQPVQAGQPVRPTNR